MDKDKKKTSSWLERVEDIINVLKDSSIGEFELTEGDTKIIIRRSPGMVLTSLPTTSSTSVAGKSPVNGTGRTAKSDTSVPIVAPLTGVYYAAPTPTSSPFVAIGDVVQTGQVVALVEAMKVFNEVTADVTGRVTKLSATSGTVVQKGDVLLRIEPI